MSKSTSPSPDGLIYDHPDVTTEAEINEFREFYIRTKGYSLPAFEFWLEFRPDVLKRYRSGTRFATSAEEKSHPLPHVLAMLHYYAIRGYHEGILYEVKLCQSMGATKGEILDTLAFAFIHGSPLGMNFVATSSTEYIRNWSEPPQMDRYAQGWSFDPDAFKSGMDFSTAETNAAEMERLTKWYASTLGEVPKYVTFLKQHRPEMLKAYRNRFEHAVREALPKQMVPYLLLNYNAIRGFSDGIREAVLLARHFEMTRPQILDAITWAFYYGGVDALSIVDDVAGDILKKM
jgi:hypothetical protein